MFRHLTLTALAITMIIGAFVASAGNGQIRKAKYPIKNSYLVVLNKDTPKKDVPIKARSLAQMANGRSGAILTHAIKAFEFRGSEQAAQALAHNP